MLIMKWLMCSHTHTEEAGRQITDNILHTDICHDAALTLKWFLLLGQTYKPMIWLTPFMKISPRLYIFIHPIHHIPYIKPLHLPHCLTGWSNAISRQLAKGQTPGSSLPLNCWPAQNLQGSRIFYVIHSHINGHTHTHTEALLRTPTNTLPFKIIHMCLIDKIIKKIY